MLLQHVTLHNIRSYQQATIQLEEGTTLLSGDIGSGKSTILFAIEFALFGTSRPDLPAEMLLRKGTTQGSVELTFLLQGKEVTIKRQLKKEKRGIKQLPGHLIINNEKKELMPVELKAAVISLLGYPEELLTKSKNYIFRYTVYTPQEEMKFILQEKAEDRLDVLRKIFNIDKYKTIRDNVQLYLKDLRVQIATLTTKCEPLQEHKDVLKNVVEERTKVEGTLSSVRSTLETTQKQSSLLQQQVRQLEEQQKQVNEMKQQREGYTTRIKDGRGRIETLHEKEKTITKQLEAFPTLPDTELTMLEEQQKEMQARQEWYRTQKQLLETQTKQLQQQIYSVQEEIQTLTEQVSKIPEKEKILSNKVDVAPFVAQQQNVEKEWEQITTELATHSATVMHAQQLCNTMSSLDTCPTCLQDVSSEHKQSIIGTEQKKVETAETQQKKLEERRKVLSEEKIRVQQEIEKLRTQEQQQAVVRAEIVSLREKENVLGTRKELIVTLTKENNQLMQQLQELASSDISIIQKELEEITKHIKAFSQKKIIEQNLRETKEEVKTTEVEVQQTQQKLTELEDVLTGLSDPTETITKRRTELETLQATEKQHSIQIAGLETTRKHLLERENELKEVIEKLTELHMTLVHHKEMHHWLESHFIKLTHTIEKHVMVTIHRLFNQLFQEWFSILMEDDSVRARIDDSFTPILEQNGYEVLFQNVSGGERTSAALSYRLALNKVINDVVHQINTKNLLILDEPTDGFSSQQLDKVRDVLDKLNVRQTIIVSHEAKIESFVERVIRVQKEGHVSSL